MHIHGAVTFFKPTEMRHIFFLNVKTMGNVNSFKNYFFCTGPIIVIHFAWSLKQFLSSLPSKKILEFELKSTVLVNRLLRLVNNSIHEISKV